MISLVPPKSRQVGGGVGGAGGGAHRRLAFLALARALSSACWGS